MLKAIKEIIIMLLVCLVGMLLFAVIFYEYIPARKVVAEVANYEASENVESLLTDDIDTKEDDVILTFQEGSYEVTSTDLNNYQTKDIYVPGKANPFEPVSEDPDGDVDDTNSTDTNSSTGNSTSNTTNSNATDNNTYMKDTGTK